MFSDQYPLRLASTVKTLAFLCALLAAAVDWHAARLWLRASRIEMPVFDPSMTSIGDVPELHILNAAVQLNETARALRQSGGLNASAARWTAAVAILTGAAAILGTV